MRDFEELNTGPKSGNPSSFSPTLQSTCVVHIYFGYNLATCNTLLKTLLKSVSFCFFSYPQAETDALIFASYNQISFCSYCVFSQAYICYSEFRNSSFKSTRKVCSGERIYIPKQLISALQAPEKEQSRTIPRALRATPLKLIQTMFPKLPCLCYLFTQCLPKRFLPYLLPCSYP